MTENAVYETDRSRREAADKRRQNIAVLVAAHLCQQNCDGVTFTQQVGNKLIEVSGRIVKPLPFAVRTLQEWQRGG